VRSLSEVIETLFSGPNLWLRRWLSLFAILTLASCFAHESLASSVAWAVVVATLSLLFRWPGQVSQQGYWSRLTTAAYASYRSVMEGEGPGHPGPSANSQRPF
jgi:hypothetical protein